MSDESDAAKIARRLAYSPVLQVEDFRPLSSTVRVTFGACSDGRPPKGPNEDHYLIFRLGRSQETLLTSLPLSDLPPRFSEYGYAMCVADGIGGTGPGALASRVAITTLAQLVLEFGRWNVRVDSRTAFEIVERMDWGYTQAEAAVRQRASASRYLETMSTQVTAAYSAGDELFVARAGRTPVYIFREGRLLALAAPDPAEPAPPRVQRPRLVHDENGRVAALAADAADPSDKPTVKVNRYLLRDGDMLMLCSNGLPMSLTEDQIADTLSDRRHLKTQCRRLVDAALDVRSNENVTVLLAQYRIPRSDGGQRF
jgi:serine/threonine protein phosphatase PrpC